MLLVIVMLGLVSNKYIIKPTAGSDGR
jgi:hypothetical protein